MTGMDKGFNSMNYWTTCFVIVINGFGRIRKNKGGRAKIVHLYVPFADCQSRALSNVLVPIGKSGNGFCH